MTDSLIETIVYLQYSQNVKYEEFSREFGGFVNPLIQEAWDHW